MVGEKGGARRPIGLVGERAAIRLKAAVGYQVCGAVSYKSVVTRDEQDGRERSSGACENDNKHD
jgi:hypothetical protein